MNFITKLLLIVFFNFIALKVYTIDIPKDLIVKVIKESENEDDIKSKNLDLISVKYTGWIFDSNVPTNNYCDAKGKMFDSNIFDTFNHTKTISICFRKRHSYKRMGSRSSRYEN